MSMVDITRHSGILSADTINAHSATVVGVGAIGSKIAEVLVKMGIPKLHMWDDDIVATHNVANQGFGVCDVGKHKASCLQQRLTADTGADIKSHVARITSVVPFDTTIVVSAVDSMSGRKLVFDSFLRSPKSQYFLDGRMAARFGSVYLVDKNKASDVRAYRESLCDDDEVAELPCTQKSTIFCAFGIAGFMGEVITKFLRGDEITANHIDIYFENLMLISCSAAEPAESS